jgi:hypothetical protein
MQARTTDAGIVSWTRGCHKVRTDSSLTIRERFTEPGVTEISSPAPADSRFRVGVHRLDRATAQRCLQILRRQTGRQDEIKKS